MPIRQSMRIRAGLAVAKDQKSNAATGSDIVAHETNVERPDSLEASVRTNSIDKAEADN